MDYESNSWIWEGVYYYPYLFGGLMVTAALLGLSTSYFGVIGVPSLPLPCSWYNLGKKKKTGLHQLVGLLLFSYQSFVLLSLLPSLLS
jgi:ethanolamine-phosphate cytidylyltransferase